VAVLGCRRRRSRRERHRDELWHDGGVRGILGTGLGVCVLVACGSADGGRGSGTLGVPTATSGVDESDGSTSGTSGSTAAGDDATSAVPTTGMTLGSSTSLDDGSSGGLDDAGTSADTGAMLSCPGPADPMDCSPGPGSGEGDTCVDDPSCFLDLVQASVNGVISEIPQWFDQSSGQPYVLEVELYMNEVVARVSAAGQCAIRDPNAGDEIAVKHDNAFAENFDILTAEGFARYGDGIYTSKCIPAWF
jgi:hypothetical protein